MSFLLRVTLPDRPGSLGALALALGSAGADIYSLDVLERGDGYAVDDIVVDVPTGTMPDALITAAEKLDGVIVESLQPFGGMLEANRELELIDSVASAGNGAWQLLADRVPATLRVGWALVLEDPDRIPRGGGPIVARGASAPESCDGTLDEVYAITRATTFDNGSVPAEWTTLDTTVAAAPLSDGRVLVVGRTGGAGFRPSEIARLDHFAGILRSLASH